MSEMTNTLQGRVNVVEKKTGEFENSSSFWAGASIFWYFAKMTKTKGEEEKLTF